MEEKQPELEGEFFDDFDAAFGSDNDVDILIIKKENSGKKEEEKEPSAEKQEEA